MAQYRITCTNQLPFGEPPQHAHIVAVGTGTAAGYDTLWTLDQVLLAMSNGHVFYTVSPSTNKIALVENYYCSKCSRYHIRSSPDAVTDNNLDSLPYCKR